jgi:hypothetical protein
LAIALESGDCCVRHLDLSSNNISDEGAVALGRALSSNPGRRGLETLDLSNNQNIKDSGATAIAGAFEKNMIRNILIRSCHIQADGAAAFAKALKSLGRRSSKLSNLRLDLSGNPLGILRKKSKPGLKSMASSTAGAYISMIGKTVQKGLQDFGTNGPSAESDDDEDAKMNGMEEEDDAQDPSKVKCGALAFANAFIDSEDDKASSTTNQAACAAPRVELGLRRCFFDTRAADALAAVKHVARESMAMDLTMDVTMNNVLEDEVVLALSGDSELEEYLNEMAERHLEAWEALRVARERARRAAEAAGARIAAEAKLEASWGAPVEIGGEDDLGEEDKWDSDADYEDGDVAEEDDYF